VIDRVIDKEVIKGFLDGLRPLPRLTVSQWSDEHRYLSPQGAAEPGRYRTDRAPYLREIMDNLSALSPVQKTIVMKGAQLGFTEAGNNWVGYVIDIAPAATMMVQPTEDTVKRNSKVRINPMIEATPRLREKMGAQKSKDASQTNYYKEFPGGVLVMTWATSATGLRSIPIKNLFLDEVDGYPLDIEGEGSPIELARARSRTFPTKKEFMISTPTVEGQSVIESEFLQTDQRYYFVPCPHCGEHQTLKFENLKWEKGKPETVLYFCEHCGTGIEEHHKVFMLENGEWRATQPDNSAPHIAGYHINSLYAPYGWYRWHEIARDWEKAQGDTPKLKAFTNTVLGETWKQTGEAPPWENLYNRREAYPINRPQRDVAFLTAGVDIQRDRIEIEIVGWCKGKKSYSVDYRVLVGDTSKTEVWDALAEIVDEQWEREDGGIMPLAMMAVDTGYNTSEVYAFCRRFDTTKVIPVKGVDKNRLIIAAPRAVDTTKDGKATGKVKVWPVGVSVVKEELYGWLRLNQNEDGTFPNGFCHFPQYDQHHFKSLTAEKLEFKTSRGFRVYQWVKKYERNERLDCRVYARAAAAVMGLDRRPPEWFDELIAQYEPKPEGVPKTPEKQVRRSSYWDRNR
jgi:phage terminase large subunit GpA-like protein